MQYRASFILAKPRKDNIKYNIYDIKYICLCFASTLSWHCWQQPINRLENWTVTQLVQLLNIAISLLNPHKRYISSTFLIILSSTTGSALYFQIISPTFFHWHFNFAGIKYRRLNLLRPRIITLAVPSSQVICLWYIFELDLLYCSVCLLIMQCLWCFYLKDCLSSYYTKWYLLLLFCCRFLWCRHGYLVSRGCTRSYQRYVIWRHRAHSSWSGWTVFVFWWKINTPTKFSPIFFLHWMQLL